MNVWKGKIINLLIKHYFKSAGEEEERSCLIIRSSILFPDFDSAHPEEKKAYLDAALYLAQKKVIKLRWEKKRRGERLKTINCKNFERLFRAAGRPFPKAEVERTKSMLAEKVQTLKQALSDIKGNREQAEKVITLLEFLSHHFGLREVRQGLDQKVMSDLVKLLEFHFNPSRLEKITSRALSIMLYQDSKYLEDIPAFCHHLFKRLQKTIPLPDITFLQRSFPETLISGKIAVEFKNRKAALINGQGHILGLPLETAEKIASIKPVSSQQTRSGNFRRWLAKHFSRRESATKTALIIENKETFYALAAPQDHNGNGHLGYDCFLYSGGYPNRAVTALIKILAASDFSIYYTGDMDPDGILILQYVRDVARQAAPEKQVIPVKMDSETYNKYLPWARNLTKGMLLQMERVREDTKAIPGLADLISRIIETKQGVEQEIVDYR